MWKPSMPCPWSACSSLLAVPGGTKFPHPGCPMPLCMDRSCREPQDTNLTLTRGRQPLATQHFQIVTKVDIAHSENGWPQLLQLKSGSPIAFSCPSKDKQSLRRKTGTHLAGGWGPGSPVERWELQGDGAGSWRSSGRVWPYPL